MVHWLSFLSSLLENTYYAYCKGKRNWLLPANAIHNFNYHMRKMITLLNEINLIELIALHVFFFFVEFCFFGLGCRFFVVFWFQIIQLLCYCGGTNLKQLHALL